VSSGIWLFVTVSQPQSVGFFNDSLGFGVHTQKKKKKKKRKKEEEVLQLKIKNSSDIEMKKICYYYFTRSVLYSSTRIFHMFIHL